MLQSVDRNRVIGANDPDAVQRFVLHFQFVDLFITERVDNGNLELGGQQFSKALNEVADEFIETVREPRTHDQNMSVLITHDQLI